MGPNVPVPGALYYALTVLFVFHDYSPGTDWSAWITACGPGAQVLEQQRRQIAEKQQIIKETRRRIQAERDRVAQQQQRAYDELLAENRRLIIAAHERVARERQRNRGQHADTAAPLFVTHALALRAAAVAGSRAASDILANAPGTILLTDGADTDATLAVVWSPLFENAVVKFGRVGAPRPVGAHAPRPGPATSRGCRASERASRDGHDERRGRRPSGPAFAGEGGRQAAVMKPTGRRAAIHTQRDVAVASGNPTVYLRGRWVA